MRQARTGLIHGLQMRDIAQPLFALLGLIKIAHQLCEQVNVQQHGRAERLTGVHGQVQLTLLHPYFMFAGLTDLSGTVG